MDTTATPHAPATSGATARDLAGAIEAMDSLSQDGFQSIIAVAKLALIALESPAGHRNFNTLAFALETIVHKADESLGLVNYEAEKVGHPWRDEAHERRNRAAREAALHS